MKTHCYFFITALLLCVTSLAKAGSDVEFAAEVSSSNSFVLRLDNPVEAKVQVSLKDRNGYTLHEEGYGQSNIRHTYNLKNLPLGEYVLIVQFNDIIQLQPISKTEGDLEIDPQKRQRVLPPEMDYTSGYLNLSMIYPEDLSVYVKVEDDFGHVLYHRNQKANGQVQQRFNLNQLENGLYHFSVNIDGDYWDHTYSKPLSLGTD